jgi:hypothetical protein
MVRTANTPSEAFRLGKDRRRTLRRDWESAKDTVMFKAVPAKFTQYPELRELTQLNRLLFNHLPGRSLPLMHYCAQPCTTDSRKTPAKRTLPRVCSECQNATACVKIPSTGTRPVQGTLR